MSEAKEKVLYLPMTDERRERMARAAHEIVDLLKQHCESPIEAHAVLQLVKESLEETYDIHASFLSKERIQ